MPPPTPPHMIVEESTLGVAPLERRTLTIQKYQFSAKPIAQSKDLRFVPRWKYVNQGVCCHVVSCAVHHAVLNISQFHPLTQDLSVSRREAPQSQHIYIYAIEGKYMCMTCTCMHDFGYGASPCPRFPVMVLPAEKPTNLPNFMVV